MIQAKEVLSGLERGEMEIVDVRTPAEFRSRSIEGVVNVPLDRLKEDAYIKSIPKEKELIVICQSGQRAKMAQKKLEAEGFLHIQVMNGGMEAWDKEGLPVLKGKEIMSLERQVRIAAGFLVFTGTLLGWKVNGGFYGIPAFVGAGLIFAGITNTCAMGMLIAKLPWNAAPRCK